MTAAMLPSGFETLEPFVATWAIEGSAARAAQRGARSPEERQAFYNAAGPELDRALTYLDGKPLDKLDPAEARLMNLMLSLAHVTLAIEVQKEDEAQLTNLTRYMRITRSPADA